MNFSHMSKLEFLPELWFLTKSLHVNSGHQYWTLKRCQRAVPLSARPQEGRERLLIKANGKVMALSSLEGLRQDETEWKLQSLMSYSGIRGSNG